MKNIIDIADHQQPPPRAEYRVGVTFDCDVTEIARNIYRDQGKARACTVAVILQSIAAGWIDPGPPARAL